MQSLADIFFVPILKCDVAEGDDTDQPFVPVEDRQAMDLPFGHLARDIADLVILEGVIHLRDHHVADNAIGGRLAFYNGPDRDVAVRNQADEALDLRVTLASALMESKGHVHPDVAAVLARARDLIVETDATGTILHFSVLYGLWVAQYLGSEPIAALDQSKEFLSLAQSQLQSGLPLVGHRLLGTTLILTGDYRTALFHLDRAVELYRRKKHQELAFRFGADIGITAQCVRALAPWHRGFPDQARSAFDQGLQQAQGSVHRHTLRYAFDL